MHLPFYLFGGLRSFGGQFLTGCQEGFECLLLLQAKTCDVFVAIVDGVESTAEVVGKGDELVVGIDMMFMLDGIEAAEPFVDCNQSSRINLGSFGIVLEVAADVVELNLAAVYSLGQGFGLGQKLANVLYTMSGLTQHGENAFVGGTIAIEQAAGSP